MEKIAKMIFMSVSILGFLLSAVTPLLPTLNSRPTLMGTHGAVACGHYLAAEAGMRILRAGGNAIDAGVAQVLAQSVLEYGVFGFGGECPILIYSARDREVYAINGNTVAPKKATLNGLKKIIFSLYPMTDSFALESLPYAMLLSLPLANLEPWVSPKSQNQQSLWHGMASQCFFLCMGGLRQQKRNSANGGLLQQVSSCQEGIYPR